MHLTMDAVAQGNYGGRCCVCALISKVSIAFTVGRERE